MSVQIVTEIGRLSKPLIALMVWLTAGDVRAQEPSFVTQTHAEQLQTLALACLGPVPLGLNEIQIDSDGKHRYIESVLINYWMEEGMTVFDGSGSKETGAIPGLRFSVDTSTIILEKTSSGDFRRTANIGIEYVLTGPNAQVLADSRCDTAQSDTISSEQANAFRDSRFPETDIESSSRSWFRSFLEPAVTIGAAAVGTYLFFNLRSERADG